MTDASRGKNSNREISRNRPPFGPDMHRRHLRDVTPSVDLIANFFKADPTAAEVTQVPRQQPVVQPTPIERYQATPVYDQLKVEEAERLTGATPIHDQLQAEITAAQTESTPIYDELIQNRAQAALEAVMRIHAEAPKAEATDFPDINMRKES